MILKSEDIITDHELIRKVTIDGGFTVEFTISNSVMFIEVDHTYIGKWKWNHIVEINGATSIFQYCTVMNTLWNILYSATKSQLTKDEFGALVDTAINANYTFLKRS